MVNKRQDHSADLLALKYQGLLDVSEAIVSYRDLTKLFLDLEAKLRQVIDFDFATVSLYDQERNLLHRFLAHVHWNRNLMYLSKYLLSNRWRQSHSKPVAP